MNSLMLNHHFWVLKKLGWFGLVENFEREKLFSLYSVMIPCYHLQWQ